MKASLWLKRALAGAGILVLCVAVVVIGIIGVALMARQAAGRGSAYAALPTPTPAYNVVITPTCDAPGKPACPTPDPGWIALASAAPNDVLAAMKQTWIFHIDLNDGGDHIQDLSHLGAPILVRGLAPAGKTIPGFYVLPIMNARGDITDIGQFELNAAHAALRFVAVTSFDGRYPVVRQSSSAAITAVRVQRHVALKSGAQPFLVFFPINGDDLRTGKVVWKAGGLWPGEPLWLIPGADGQNYIFGNDGKVYAEGELPMSM